MTSKRKNISLKEKLFAHFEAWRVYSLLWSGLVSLVGACVAVGDFPSLRTSLLVFFIPVTGWIAGLYAMDFLDKELDAIEKSNRPIPSGRIKPKEAVICAFIFAGIGLILSFQLSFMNIIIVFIIASTVMAYTLISKSRGLLQNFNRGLITWVTFFFGYLAVNHTLSPQIILFSLLFFFHDFSTNIIGALRDMKGDKEGGFRTTPVRYGVTKALFIALCSSIIFISIIIYSVLENDIVIFSNRFYFAFVLSLFFVVALYSIGFYYRKHLDRKKALIVHGLFVSERAILACAFILGIASNFFVSFTVFLIIVFATTILQILIRKRYEIIES